jgi:phosphonate transport system substrate-binding protein
METFNMNTREYGPVAAAFMKFSPLRAIDAPVRGKGGEGSTTMRLLRKISACALPIVAGFWPAVGQADLTLSFGVYSSDKPSSMVKQFRPILNKLEQNLTEIRGEPVKIRMHVAKSYQQGLSDLVSGKVDFSRFGPASYVTAKESDNSIEILVIESNKGSKVFNGVIAVGNDSPIKSIADLRGKSFAFGDEESTIGRYLAQLYLMRNGLHAADLGSYEYLGRHDAVGAAVGGGRFDAGALKESTFAKQVEDGVPVRAIATFPNVTKPWIARGKLPPQIRTELRRALLGVTDMSALNDLRADGFVDGSDEDYAFIREAMLNNYLFFRKGNPATADASRKRNERAKLTRDE